MDPVDRKYLDKPIFYHFTNYLLMLLKYENGIDEEFLDDAVYMAKKLFRESRRRCQDEKVME